MQRMLLIILAIGMIYGEDLFFSEYAEGSSSNKYVEIYNGTGADVDLSSYSLQGTNNGTSWSNEIEIRALSSGAAGWFSLPLSQLIDMNAGWQVRIYALIENHRV